jgi:hypothetical protein
MRAGGVLPTLSKVMTKQHDASSNDAKTVSNKQCDQTNIAMATKAMMTGTLLAAAAAEGEAWALD